MTSARLWWASWYLARSALVGSPVSTVISMLLVMVSVLCVAGADHAFRQLGHAVAQLGEGLAYSADLRVDQCPPCRRAFVHHALLRRLVERSAFVQVPLLSVNDIPVRRRTITVECVPAGDAPTAVVWTAPAERVAWLFGTGPAVLIGATLAGPTSATNRLFSITTTAGRWPVAGVLRSRALLSREAAQNTRVIVPWQPPFHSLCANGRETWRVRASDSAALTRALRQVNDELRTQLQLRANMPARWQVERGERYASVVRRLVRRFTWWVLAVPVAISLLCGAGVFCVQTLAAATRIAEFGTRRALGATRRALTAQLLAEGVLTAACGTAAACASLMLAGGWGDDVHQLLRTGAVAVAVALPMTVIGVLLPGWSALRASSIAALEHR